MVDIDYIMSCLDWNKDLKEQMVGIDMAKNVESINVFIQPCNKKYNKNVWDNCAKILSDRTNEELSPYLIELMNWLQDLNWPGAYCILDRLKKMKEDPLFQYAYNICLKYSKALGDEEWENNLKKLVKKD